MLEHVCSSVYIVRLSDKCQLYIHGNKMHDQFVRLSVDLFRQYRPAQYKVKVFFMKVQEICAVPSIMSGLSRQINKIIISLGISKFCIM